MSGTPYIITIYFLYGLAFFSMGLLVALEGGRAPDARLRKALRPLAGFGILHGAHEWMEMFEHINKSLGYAQPPILTEVRLAILAVSFISLAAFGSYLLITSETSQRYVLLIPLGIEILWAFGLLALRGRYASGDLLTVADVWTRYILAIPSAILASAGLITQQRIFRKSGLVHFGQDALWAAVTLGWYGLVGQIFVHPSLLPPSNTINQELFLEIFGFPVQLFRAFMALGAAIFIIRFLRAFQVENDRKIAKLQAARLEEAQQREALRGELYRRVIAAQEAERQRIARDLHDETGQALTAIGLGLRGLSTSIGQQAGSRQSQDTLHQLETMVTHSLNELQRLITDLRPSHLDDLGLPAAIRWYTGKVRERTGLKIKVEIIGKEQEIYPEFKTAMFRVLQEALTNIVKHANATQVKVQLIFEPDTVRIRVEDDGCGFEVNRIRERTTWGLLGMQERTTLLGGRFTIRSSPGKGTLVEAVIPLSSEAREEKP
ncbi:MAG: sensor histidine kinase [Chloroflexi bacterium]|nr:sensor histidine kinase [Chloroflexota bacterium]